MGSSSIPERHGDRFDETFDVIVVGFGFAGGTSAIAAHDEDAERLIVEKMPDPGGNGCRLLPIGHRSSKIALGLPIELHRLKMSARE